MREREQERARVGLVSSYVKHDYKKNISDTEMFFFYAVIWLPSASFFRFLITGIFNVSKCMSKHFQTYVFYYCDIL